MKSVWKGTISFGLVTIPIELYSAVEAHTLGFKLLHKKDNSPITYQRVCQTCNKEVAWNDIVKGYKLPDGSYFIMTPSNIEKLKPKKTDEITIKEFVDTSAIEPIYYEHHYYVTPSKSSDRAFFLFLAALESLQLSAIGTFVMKDKEYVCAIKNYKNGLLLSTLHYEYEIRKFSKFSTLSVPAKKNTEELNLAEQLIQKLYTKKFDMTPFKDTFAQELLKRIKAKAKGIKIPMVEKPVKPKPEPSLIDALKASLQPQPVIHTKSISRIKARA